MAAVSPSPEISRPAGEILKATVGNVNRLPTLPETATRAMEVANAPNSSMGDFAAVIERDPPIAAGILRWANSAIYNTTGRPILDLRQATVRLGLRECKNLLIGVGMRSLLQSIPPARKARCEVLWRHAFLTACLSRRLNQSLELGYQGEDFSAGLAHDLGRILIAIGVPHLFESADPMAFGDEADVLAHEQSILGTNHAEFGAWFCEQNKLPASLVTVVRFHHTPARAASHHNLVALVATADHMANYIQRLGGAEGFDPETNLHWRSFADRLASGMRQKIAQIAVRMMTETIQEADAANTLA